MKLGRRKWRNLKSKSTEKKLEIGRARKLEVDRDEAGSRRPVLPFDFAGAVEDDRGGGERERVGQRL